MPISHNVTVKPITEDDFHTLDYEVMSAVFSIHKDLGRFYEEKIYQFLSHTSLKAIQWINFNHAEVQFRTITHPSIST